MLTNDIAIIISTCILVIVLLFNKKIAKRIVCQQNKSWGFRFGEKSIRITEKLLIFIAFLFFIFTILIKFNTI